MVKTNEKDKKNKQTVSKTEKVTTKKVPAKTTSKKSSEGKTKKETAVKTTKASTKTKKTEAKTNTKKLETSKKATTKTAEKATKTAKTSAKRTTKTAAKKGTTTKRKTQKGSLITAQAIPEYYDLPSTYNQTTVKLLFQTPKKLFVYWEISEADKQKYFDEQGNDFFEKTTPFLVVRNKTKNYSFEIEINDFANSWYFDVPDSNCDYEVLLFRKHKVTRVPTYITTSNNLEVPNNRILFEQNRKEIFFKNVKTNAVTSKTVVNLQIMHHLGRFYSANEFYKKFYTDEDLTFISNPTSH